MRTEEESYAKLREVLVELFEIEPAKITLEANLYWRERGLLPRLASLIPQLFGRGTPLICMEGDICRRDLLLEVEGIYALPGGA